MESIGQYLKRSREQRVLSLEDLARETRIPIDTLDSLESDRLDRLPAEVFVRGFVKAYARAVSVPVDEALARHTLGRRAASVAPIATRTPARRSSKGRKLGTILGFLALLVFLTVALSLALKPPGRSIASWLACAEFQQTSPCGRSNVPGGRKIGRSAGASAVENLISLICARVTSRSPRSSQGAHRRA